MNVKSNKITSYGFTIIELVIVIVVIAILVTITAISYSTITQNAAEQSLQADLRTAASKLARYHADHGGYPSTLGDAQVSDSGNKVFTYNNYDSADSYCLVLTQEDLGYHIVSTNDEPQEGTECPPAPDLITYTGFSASYIGGNQVQIAVGTLPDDWASSDYDLWACWGSSTCSPLRIANEGYSDPDFTWLGVTPWGTFNQAPPTGTSGKTVRYQLVKYSDPLEGSNIAPVAIP